MMFTTDMLLLVCFTLNCEVERIYAVTLVDAIHT